MTRSAPITFAANRPRQHLFTENETNVARLWNLPNHSPFLKDSINDAIIRNKLELVNPNKVGTKAAAHYQFTRATFQSSTDKFACALRRKYDDPVPMESIVSFRDFDTVFAARKAEADAFYFRPRAQTISEEHRAIQRQAFAD